MAGLGLLNKPALTGEAPKLAQETGTPIFVSDLSRCQPSTALSKVNKKQHWTLIPYVTDKVSGTMIGAGSMADAPDVTIPLGVSGWHAVYVGYWNAHHDYDGDMTIKLKLTDDPCFRPISDASVPMNWSLRPHEAVEAELREVFLKYACIYICPVSFNTFFVIVVGRYEAKGQLGKVIAHVSEITPESQIQPTAACESG